MDSFRGFESGIVCDRDCMVVDTDWNVEDHPSSLDRHLVNTLLDASEGWFSKSQEADEFGSTTGWEDAVQGWGRGPSVICLFQMQRKGKKTKTTDPDFHCLLCVDTKPPDFESETTTDLPGFCGGLSEKNTKKSLLSKEDCLKSRPSSKSSVKSTELLQKQKVFGKQHSGLLINSSAATCLGLSQHQEDQCPVPKDRCASGNVGLNCFTVLPPLKASLNRNVSSPNYAKCAEVAMGVAMQDMADSLHGRVSAGVDGSGEMKTKSHLCSPCRSAEGSLHNSLASRHWSCKNGHRLLTAFSIPIITKRGDHTFPSMDDAVPRVTYRLGKCPQPDELPRTPLRHHSSNKLCLGYKTKNVRRVEPKLPMLFGTRVAIPASAHRL